MRRLPLIAVLLVLCTPTLMGAPAAAQTQAEVDSAQRELLDAEAEVEQTLRLHTKLSADLTTAIAQADVVQTQLQGVSADIVDLELEIRTRERSNSLARSDARDRLMLAYELALEADGGTVLYVGDTILDGLIASAIINRSANDLDYDPSQLGEDRDWIVEHRAQLDAAQDEVRRLSSLAESQAVTLAGLAANAQTELASARSTRVEAEAAHREAVATYQAVKASAPPSVARWLPLLEQYFAANQLVEAMEVMTCESRGNPEAVNQTSQATGLFQFLPSTWAYSSVAAGFGGFLATHPEANVASAAWLVDHSILIEHRLGPWGPWECNPRL